MLNKLIRDKQPPQVLEEARAQSEEEKPQPNYAALEEKIKQRFAKAFLRDAHRSIAVMDAFVEKGGASSAEEIRAYTIHVHGMKSALASMGKSDISATALKLEILGRENNIEGLTMGTPAFLRSLKAYVEELTPKEITAAEETTAGDIQYLTDMLLKIITACEEYDENTVGNTLTELKKTTWPRQTKDLLDKIDEQLLHCDFEEITAEISKFVSTLL
jgi:HPt (histidine-containing phosphotransfer) domain-containing protein